jgi:hypothetical protein
MKRHESKYNPAVKELSNYIHNRAYDSNIRPDVLTRITNVLDGVERMDEMISQKDTELQSTKQILLQKRKRNIVRDK